MKEIKLFTGEICQIDDIDYSIINKYKWYIDSYGYTYAYNGFNNGKQRNIFMHRLILGLTNKNIQCDHIDHNRLNNQRSNLRQCTFTENRRNVSPRGRSKYLGVLYQKRKIQTKIGLKVYEEIIARIRIDGKYKKLGHFNTEEEAAIAYDNAARIHYKEFANLNFK